MSAALSSTGLAEQDVQGHAPRGARSVLHYRQQTAGGGDCGWVEGAGVVIAYGAAEAGSLITLSPVASAIELMAGSTSEGR